MTVSRVPFARLAAAVATCLIASAIPLTTGAGLPSAHADGTAVTVTGPNPAWDQTSHPAALRTDLPTATVSQTQSVVDQTLQVSWTNFSTSTYSSDPLTPVPGIFYQPQTDLYPVWVMECRGTNPTNYLTTNTTNPDCYETYAGRTDGPGGLGNSVLAVSNRNGSGQVSFHVENAQTNSVLGCDPTHPCSIVVLPVFGGQQAANFPVDCADHSQDYNTDANGYNPTSVADENALGLDCSWANRLVIPLHFAPTPTSCTTTSPAFSAAGSPMLGRAMSQWQAGWCQGSSPLHFAYNVTNNEYQARSSFLSGGGALTSSTDVALTTQPGTGIRKHTYAPIANTAIAIAFVVDNPKTGTVIPSLNLNARLVAKMLTQSYALRNYDCTSAADPSKQSFDCDPAVRGNPNSIFVDPEFMSLNPHITAGDYAPDNLSIGQFLPTVVSGNSDLTWTLTSWIQSDPNARAFLAGLPDRWGMHINTYYKGIQYPVSSLQALDPGYTAPAPDPSGNGTMQNAWQPVSGLDTVGKILVGNSASAQSNVQTSCAAPPCSFPRVIDQLGARALFAVLDEGTAAAYNFPTAALVNAAGHAVAPTTAGVSAALGAMTTNADGITQSPAFTSTVDGAYPLSVVDYAMVPTCGASSGVAAGIQSFLSHVAAAQTYGVAPGTIAPGYWALSAKQLTQVAAASSAVSTSSCRSATTSGGQSGPSSAGQPPADSGGSNNSGGTRTAGANQGGTAAGPSTNGAPSGSNNSTSSPSARNAAFGYKPPAGAQAMGWVLPGLLILGAVLLLGGPGVYLAFTTGVASAVAVRTRRLYRSIRP